MTQYALEHARERIAELEQTVERQQEDIAAAQRSAEALHDVANQEVAKRFEAEATIQTVRTSLEWARRQLKILVTEDDGSGVFVRRGSFGVELAGFGAGMSKLDAALAVSAPPDVVATFAAAEAKFAKADWPCPACGSVVWQWLSKARHRCSECSSWGSDEPREIEIDGAAASLPQPTPARVQRDVVMTAIRVALRKLNLLHTVGEQVINAITEEVVDAYSASRPHPQTAPSAPTQEKA